MTRFLAILMAAAGFAYLASPANADPRISLADTGPKMSSEVGIEPTLIGHRSDFSIGFQFGHKPQRFYRHHPGYQHRPGYFPKHHQQFRPVQRIHPARAHMRWCHDRYRSYRAWDNTFQPHHGPRRACRSPFGG